MSPSDYSEDRLVQETTASFLRDELGWRSLWAPGCWGGRTASECSGTGKGSPKLRDSTGVLCR